MLKSFLTLLIILSCIGSKGQNARKEAIVITRSETRMPDGFQRRSVDTLFARNNFILEPIFEFYSNDETTLSTNSSRVSPRSISSGKRLKWYCLTDLTNMMGMEFDIERNPTSKTIEPYEFGEHKMKKGMNFAMEPYLSDGLTLSDYSKDKDTLINGQKCFFVVRNRVFQKVSRGRKLPKVIQFRMAINPALKSYEFPFIGEKIVDHFGGGAIVYLDGKTETGITFKGYNTYVRFTAREEKLFDHYQALYDANAALLDRFKKKK